MEKTPKSVKGRILYLITYYGDKREDFFNRIGMSYGNFKGKAKDTDINSQALVAVLNVYKEVNTNWLLKGEGNMLKETIVEDPGVSYRANNIKEKYIKQLEADNELLRNELEQKQDVIDQLLKLIKQQEG